MGAVVGHFDVMRDRRLHFGRDAKTGATATARTDSTGCSRVDSSSENCETEFIDGY